MKLSEYLIEAVAKRKSGKYGGIKPYKESVIEWLNSKGFIPYEWDYSATKHLRYPRMTYMTGPYRNAEDGEASNWISIHTPDIYELVAWFDTDGIFTRYRIIRNRNGSSNSIHDFKGFSEILSNEI
jgi:hypothetical protein